MPDTLPLSQPPPVALAGPPKPEEITAEPSEPLTAPFQTPAPPEAQPDNSGAHPIDIPHSSPADFEAQKASILAAHPTRASLEKYLQSLEARHDTTVAEHEASIKRLEEEVDKVRQDQEMGRKLWVKQIELLEGMEGREEEGRLARERFKARLVVKDEA
ncbi:MAG: hypothetical protein M1824_005198 [Vezdaea acicularis]|nr:MAG: hypothetical protein M1824_005198 [Vezdaea acicularis]